VREIYSGDGVVVLSLPASICDQWKEICITLFFSQKPKEKGDFRNNFGKDNIWMFFLLTNCSQNRRIFAFLFYPYRLLGVRFVCRVYLSVVFVCCCCPPAVCGCCLFRVVGCQLSGASCFFVGIGRRSLFSLSVPSFAAISCAAPICDAPTCRLTSFAIYMSPCKENPRPLTVRTFDNENTVTSSVCF
jgi:hypothetical protein